MSNQKNEERVDRGVESGQQVAPDMRFLAQKGTYECYGAKNEGCARVWKGATRDSKKTVMYSPHRRGYSPRGVCLHRTGKIITPSSTQPSSSWHPQLHRGQNPDRPSCKFQIAARRLRASAFWPALVRTHAAHRATSRYPSGLLPRAFIGINARDSNLNAFS